MSKYQLNKAIKLLTFHEDPEPRQHFIRDPGSYSMLFELTEQERAALTAKDVGAMYGMGIQPFLLVAFAQLAWGRKFESFQDLLSFQKEFSAVVSKYGYPNMET